MKGMRSIHNMRNAGLTIGCGASPQLAIGKYNCGGRNITPEGNITSSQDDI